MRVLLIVESVRGQGHLVRSTALMEELVRRGHTASRFGNAQAVNTVSDYDIVVFDGYNFTYEDLTKFDTVPVVLIEDHPCSSPDDRDDHRKGDAPVDLLINCSAAGFGNQQLHDSGLRYKEPRFSRKAKGGAQFSMLRPEFIAATWVGCEKSTKKAVDLRDVSGLSAAEMAQQMATAGIVITYGGMIAMECACVGAPMIVIERDADEEMNCVMLATSGACGLIRSDTWAYQLRDLGEEGRERWLADNVTARLNELEYHAQSRGRIASNVLKNLERAKGLVDGRGAERVVTELEELVNDRR